MAILSGYEKFTKHKGKQFDTWRWHCVYNDPQQAAAGYQKLVTETNELLARTEYFAARTMPLMREERSFESNSSTYVVHARLLYSREPIKDLQEKVSTQVRDGYPAGVLKT